MAKVIVLGAGFSHALADLPLTRHMYDAFTKVLNEARSARHPIRIEWGEAIFEFIHWLENEYMLKHLRGAAEDEVSLIRSPYRERFELLLTYLDLNVGGSERIEYDINGKRETASWGPGLFSPGHGEHHLRTCIETYIHLALMGGNPKRDLLEKFCQVLLKSGDLVISFNYDLVLERFLFEMERWFPQDGYGVEFQRFPSVAAKFAERTSDVAVLKLHGSLNWESASFLGMPCQSNKDVCLTWLNDAQEELFPGYLDTPPVRLRVPYQGGHALVGLIPSWVKRFEMRTVMRLWHQASAALRNATEVVIIGYSLPSEDSAAACLFTGIDYSNKPVTIIDPCASSLRNRYQQFMEGAIINATDKPLEKYLDENTGEGQGVSHSHN